tara:strand:- start:11604 stop:12134 length:531 start_codon:yes stop_codon:yes gene_type:complete
MPSPWIGGIAIVFASILSLISTPHLAAQDTGDPGKAIVERYLTDGSREKTLEQIRAQEELKQRQAAERMALEVEIRTTMKRIRSLLFEFELFLAGLQDGISKPDCSQVEVLEQSISETSGQLEVYEDKCRAIPDGAGASQEICSKQIAELTSELAALANARQTMIEQCAAVGVPKP